MLVFDDFKEIAGIMVLIVGFLIALAVLPDAMQKPGLVYAPTLLPAAQQDAQVEKITVPIHNLFAN